MWWFVAWAIMAALCWFCLVILAASVPSTERASKADVFWMAVISIVGSGIFVAIAFAVTAAIKGVF